MKSLFALAIIAVFSSCGPIDKSVPPPGMPLEREHHPTEPNQALSRNLTGDRALSQ